MQAAYGLSGGKLTIKKYKMAAAHAAGIFVIRGAEAATGLTTCTTTGAADTVGLTLDQGLYQGAPISTYSTTQGDPETVYSVCVNPDLVVRALLVGTAASGGMLRSYITTAASNGLTATSTTGNVADFSSPDCDEGMIWYTSGNAANQSRVVTSTAATVVTVIVPFAANAVGDEFLVTPFNVGIASATFSTNLLNVRGDLAQTGAAWMTVDHELNGYANSYVHGMSADHVFSGVST